MVSAQIPNDLQAVTGAMAFPLFKHITNWGKPMF
jgi:hypothetical protein